MVISIQLGDGWSLIETDTWLFRYSWVSLMIETDTWLFRYGYISWVMDGVRLKQIHGYFDTVG